jgi:hypothetical protein
LTQLKNGVFQADGRKVHPSVKRKSLNTRDPKVALQRLKELDRMVRQELVFGVGVGGKNAEPIELRAGMEEYLAYAGRPRVAKGCKEATVKNYRSKLTVAVAEFQAWGLAEWQQIGLKELYRYAEILDRRGFAIRTQGNMLVIVKQLINHFLEQKRLVACTPFAILSVRGAEPRRERAGGNAVAGSYQQHDDRAVLPLTRR